jgi:bacterioferritin
VEGTSLAEMIKEDLVAEHIGMESCSGMIRALGTADSTTRRMLERILEAEEEHAEELANMLETLTSTASGGAA